MIGRALWIAALVGVGLLVTALQIDRQSPLTPGLAPLVPAPLRSYAQFETAVAALQTADPATALAEAEALVRRRPMPAEHLTLLAAAQVRAGRPEAAGLTVQLAAKRGWREPLSQEAVLGLALDAGDRPEAARRFAALFRNGSTADAKLAELAPKVFAAPAGAAEETFATIIAGAPGWHEQFLQRGARVLPPAVFGEVISLAIERDARFSCAALDGTIAALRQRDAAAADRIPGPAARRCT